MAHPTNSPKRTVIHGSSVIDASIEASGLATSAKRNVTITTVGGTVASSFNTMVFRAPPCGSTITGIYVCPGSAQNHAANEADTWIFTVKKFTGNAAMSLNIPSLSGVTLEATAFKTIPVNGGNSTLTSGERLRLEASISGSPAALQEPVVVVEWVPYTDA